MFAGVEGSSISHDFCIGARKVNVDKRNIRKIEYRFLPCRCSHCIDDEKKAIGSHASLDAPGSFG